MSYIPIVASKMDYSMFELLDHANTPKEHLASVEVSEFAVLQCNSSSGARPAMTREQIQHKAARAIAFCIQNGMNPTSYMIRKLSGLKTKQIEDYFNNVKTIRWRMKNHTYKFIDENSLVHANGYAIRDSLCRRQPRVLNSINNSNFELNPFKYEFSQLEYVLGHMGYSLFKKYVPSISPKGVDDVTDLFGVVCAIELKTQKYIHYSTGFNKALSLGIAVSKMVRAMAYSDGKIYHDASFLRYIFAYDKDNRIVHRSGEDHKADGIFHRKNGTGNVNRGSYQYLLTRNGELFLQCVVDAYSGLVLGLSKIPVDEADLLVSPDEMDNLYIRDRFILLSRCVGMIDGKYHISNSINDNGITRVYGVMTMLTAPTRRKLGYNQPDIAAALQSIVIERLVSVEGEQDTKTRYPEHFAFVLDRREYRKKIVEETGKDMGWVKKKITAIDNGGSVSDRILELSPSLKAYKNEAYDFAMDYLASIPTEQFIAAQKLSWIPNNIDDDWVRKDINKGKRFTDGRKKFGVFFNAWTQTERYLREIMKLHFTGYCHDVHDAIATKETVDVEAINKSIKDAGFKYVRVEV